MLAKELFVARWRIILCALIVVATVFYDEIHYGPREWLGSFGILVMSLVAALLGSDLIGGEVGKGTIGFLLSRPISRGRILLTKYLSSAAVLLGLTILGSGIPFVTFRFRNYTPRVVDVLFGTMWVWCAALSVLALALALSVVFKDAIVTFLLTVLGFFLFMILDLSVLWNFVGPQYYPDDDPQSFLALMVIGDTYAVWNTFMLGMTGLLLGTALLLFRRRAF